MAPARITALELMADVFVAWLVQRQCEIVKLEFGARIHLEFDNTIRWNLHQHPLELGVRLFRDIPESVPPKSRARVSSMICTAISFSRRRLKLQRGWRGGGG